MSEYSESPHRFRLTRVPDRAVARIYLCGPIRSAMLLIALNIQPQCRHVALAASPQQRICRREVQR